jgi:hypothetical protein
MQKRLAAFKYLFKRGNIKGVKVEAGEGSRKLMETLDLFKSL